MTTFRFLLQTWLQRAASRDRRELGMRAAPNSHETSCLSREAKPKPCCLGFVFALGIESGGLEDLLQDVVTIRANGLVIREGVLQKRRVALALAGPGEANASRAAELLIDGHQPRQIVSAGFAGGLNPKLHRNDILLVDRLVRTEGSAVDVEIAPALLNALEQSHVHRGPMLTVDRVVCQPQEKERLWQQYGALAVDMESFAVAEVCRRREVAFSAIRVVHDSAEEALPSDVEYLLSQKSASARLGAALGSVCRRPGSAKDFYRLWENALIASGRLARFLAEIAWT